MIQLNPAYPFMAEILRNSSNGLNSAQETRLSLWVSHKINNTLSSEALETEATEILAYWNIAQARGRFRIRESVHSTDALVHLIFSKSFEKNKERTIKAAQTYAGDLSPLYPEWKKALYINAPEVTSKIFNSLTVKVAFTAICSIGFAFGCYKLYTGLAFFIPARVIPFIINNAPLNLIRFDNFLIATAEKVLEFVELHRFRIFLSYTALYAMATRPGVNIPHISQWVRSCTPYTMFFILYINKGESVSGLVIKTILENYQRGFTYCDHIRDYFHNISDYHNQEALVIEKQKTLKVWMSLFNQPQAQAAVA